MTDGADLYVVTGAGGTSSNPTMTSPPSVRAENYALAAARALIDGPVMRNAGGHRPPRDGDRRRLSASTPTAT